jgi:septal ring factor EnvC (AmiA/AmiB activator)
MLKIQLFVAMFFGFAYLTQAQTSDTSTDKGLKEQVLKEITERFEVNNHSLDLTVNSLNKKIDSLNQKISESRNANDKALRLQERINAIEEKQKAVEQSEINVYQANYQSAIINLVSMEREIKPLILFNTTKNFFTSLDQVSNPMNYTGYNEWYKGFRSYVESNKKTDPVMSVTSTLLNLTGNLTGLSFLTGTVSNALFTSMSAFVTNGSKKKKELRDENEKMFALTMKLSQFKNDQQAIESEWEKISTELQELQKHYEKIKIENFAVLKVSATDFDESFTKENDAFKRLKYLNTLSKNTGSTVEVMKTDAPKDWKEKVYYQMMDIQALKMRFGNVTFRVKDNISRYAQLFDRYRNDPDIGVKIPVLENRLKDLSSTFDDTFNPIEYVNSATRMYKVI